jgi:hypothetical protein
VAKAGKEAFQLFSKKSADEDKNSCKTPMGKTSGAKCNGKCEACCKK